MLSFHASVLVLWLLLRWFPTLSNFELIELFSLRGRPLAHHPYPTPKCFQRIPGVPSPKKRAPEVKCPKVFSDSPRSAKYTQFQSIPRDSPECPTPEYPHNPAPRV